MFCRVGDLVRWVSDWHVYAADSLGDVHGEKPVYSWGVVLETHGKKTLVVYCFALTRKYLINLDLMDCEVISSRIKESSDGADKSR